MSGSKRILGGVVCPSRRMGIAAAVFGGALLMLLSACGQKGPLYLPPPAPPKPAVEKPADPAPRTAPVLPAAR